MITDDEIRRAVSGRAFEAGIQYQMDGRVHDLTIAANGTTVQAQVDGSGRAAYRQTVRLVRDGNGQVVPSGTCTCPVGFNCKHVAAVLLEYQEQVRPAIPDMGVPHPSESGRAPGVRPYQTDDRASVPAPISAEAPLPYDVDAWLRSLDAAQQEESEDYPPTVRKRLLYVLDRGPHSGGLIVSPQSIELKRDGTLSRTSTRHQPDQLLRPGQQPKFLRPSDRVILRQLGGMGAEGTEAFVATLQGIIATGRGRWAEWNGPALTEGSPVHGELEWRLSDDGSQRPVLVLPGPLIVLRLAAPWYVDPATGAMGPVETELLARLVQAMLAGPALPSNIAGRVRDEMGRRWPAQGLPAPKQLAPPQLLQEALQPHLLLLAGELPFDPTVITASSRYRTQPSTGPHHVALARLSWRYGPISLPAGAHFQPERTVQHGGLLFRLIRDRAAEEQAMGTALQLGLGRISHYHILPDAHPHAGDMAMIDPDPAAWLEFVLGDVPRLREAGWLVDIADDFPLRLVEPSGDISFEITERSGIDWFDLDLGVMLDGQRINLVPALLDFIANAGMEAMASLGAESDDRALPLLLPLPDGRLLNVPLDQLRSILAPLLELFTGAEIDQQTGTLRLSRRNAADLALLEAASAEGGIGWAGGDAIRALGRQLREHGGIPPCPVPSGFGAVLRSYQEHGLAWLQFLRAAGLGGVLADDMGLGKTVQALAHLAVEQAQGSCPSTWWNLRCS